MRRLRKSALAMVFLCCAVAFTDIRLVRGAPAPCDSLCRAREYFYNAGGNDYFKTDIATCQYCQGAPGGAYCTIIKGETNTTATCVVRAGGENKNKWTFIKSATVCDWDPVTASYVQSGSGTSIDGKWYLIHDMYCPP